MKIRAIALYLPQYHPIPENDEWWGKGFTEWTNVAKAKPLFRGHYQPRIPADLGFYDLRLPEVREAQAAMASDAGIEGFCYWHYWFGNGKKLLERPFEEVLSSGQPDFPFCLAWANHDWTTKTWQNGGRKEMIVQQTYPGEKDHISHFNYVLPAFLDHRYIKVDGKPLFLILEPYYFKGLTLFMDLWRKLAVEHGLKGIYFVGMGNSTSTVKKNGDGTVERVLPNLESSAALYKEILSWGFDGYNSWGKSRAEMLSQGKFLRLIRRGLHEKFPFLPAYHLNYPKVMRKEYYFAPEDTWDNIYPTLFPQWDRSPRIAKADGIYINATPKYFKKHIEDALEVISNKPAEHRILFLRSWNEWGEGNYVEPDLKYGHGYLDALKKTIK